MSSALDMFNSFQILYPNHSKQQELHILNQHVPGKNKLLIPLLYTVSIYLVIRGGHNITKGDVFCVDLGVAFASLYNINDDDSVWMAVYFGANAIIAEIYTGYNF